MVSESLTRFKFALNHLKYPYIVQFQYRKWVYSQVRFETILKVNCFSTSLYN